MKRRAERNRDIETIKDSIFEAGVSVLKAAKASEELFDSSVQALAEAMDVETSSSGTNIPVYSIHEILSARQHEAELAGDVDTYIETTEKIEFLEELEVRKLEREARKLEAQIRIETAQQQLEQFPRKSVKPTGSQSEVSAEKTESTVESVSQPTNGNKAKQWTETELKQKFRSLKNVCKVLGPEARSWKDAVKLANQRQLLD